MRIIKIEHIFMLLFLVFSCKNVHSEDKISDDVKKVIDIYNSKGAIEALKNTPWTFNLILWDNKIDYDTNPVGFITNEGGILMGDTGMGFSGCKLIDSSEDKSSVTFIVEGEKCIEKKENKDSPPDCLKWEVTTFEYKVSKDQLLKILRKEKKKLDLIGKKLKTEYRTY